MTTFERVRKRVVTRTEEAWSVVTNRTTSTTTVTATVVYTVRDAEAVPKYATPDRVTPATRLYVPTAVTVERSLGSKAEPRVDIIGCIQRKDGTLGETTHVIYAYGEIGRVRRPWPAWLTELVQDSAK